LFARTYYAANARIGRTRVTRTHTRARKEVDSLALTLRSTISYTEAADWTATTTIIPDTTITKGRHPRNTWRRVVAAGGGRLDTDRGTDGFFKSSHQGSILAWLNATHRKRSSAAARVFVDRPLSPSGFD